MPLWIAGDRGGGGLGADKKWNGPLPLDCDVFLCMVNYLDSKCLLVVPYWYQYFCRTKFSRVLQFKKS